MLAQIWPQVARADGDDFFQAHDKPGESELVFIGTVKDADGKYVEGASIKIAMKFPVPEGERKIVVDAITDSTGRYRSRNVGRTFVAMEEEVSQTLVEVSAHKAGYRTLRRFNRNISAQMGLVEVDFILGAVSKE